MKIKIGNRFIGENQPVFIIIEIGSNYNQDFATAKKMIDTIKSAGADAVKFQIFHDEKLYVKNAGRVDYLKSDVQINDLVKRAEVADEMHKKLFDYCQQAGIIYLCTPTDEMVADYLDKIGVLAYKMASYDLTNHFLLRHIAKKGKPVFFSTGAGNLAEVEEAVRVIRKAGNNKIVVLQCVAQYPAKYEYTNLKVMSTYKKKFKLPIGFSDHSADPYIVPFAATALGAKVIEKHFTLNRQQEGPDHAFAIEPEELRRMIDGIRKVELSLGAGVKKMKSGERELRRFAYRCIFATKQINKNETITTDNSYVLRPGKKSRGIEAKFYDKVLGKKAAKNIKAGAPIKWTQIRK